MEVENAFIIEWFPGNFGRKNNGLKREEGGKKESYRWTQSWIVIENRKKLKNRR